MKTSLFLKISYLFSMLYSVFFSPWYSTAFHILGNLFIFSAMFLYSFLKISSVRHKVRFALFTVASLANETLLFHSVCMHAQSLQSCPTLVTLWIVARQAPLSMGSFRQEYWSGLHVLLQGTFPAQGWNLYLMSPALAGGFFTTSATWEAPNTELFTAK